MDIGIAILVFGPALVGLFTLVVGIKLLRKPPGKYESTTVRTVLAVLCLVLTFGIGACYGLMLPFW